MHILEIVLTELKGAVYSDTEIVRTDYTVCTSARITDHPLDSIIVKLNILNETVSYV